MEPVRFDLYEKISGATSMIYDRFRKKESLNGEWHYAVDPYDTCIRQRWFEELRYDEEGNTLPLDYSFDEWELMELPCRSITIPRVFFRQIKNISNRLSMYCRNSIRNCQNAINKKRDLGQWTEVSSLCRFQ